MLDVRKISIILVRKRLYQPKILKVKVKDLLPKKWNNHNSSFPPLNTLKGFTIREIQRS